MLGGSFLPGIEAGWEAGRDKNWSLYHGATDYFPDIRFEPIGHDPGDVAKPHHKPGIMTQHLGRPLVQRLHRLHREFLADLAPRGRLPVQRLRRTVASIECRP